jgi:hypothetical protein
MDTLWTPEIFNDLLRTLAKQAGTGRHPEIVVRNSWEVMR